MQRTKAHLLGKTHSMKLWLSAPSPAVPHRSPSHATRITAPPSLPGLCGGGGEWGECQVPCYTLSDIIIFNSHDNFPVVMAAFTFHIREN